ncbi:MAG: hypothetical protein R2748_29025 [Bryobacterales bacterium]
MPSTVNVSIVIPTLLWANLTNLYIWLALAGLLGFGLIGFVDDYAKMRKARNLGLTARGKLAWQMIITLGIGSALAWLYLRNGYEPVLVLPFFKSLRPSLVFETLLSEPLDVPSTAFSVWFIFLFHTGAG